MNASPLLNSAANKGKERTRLRWLALFSLGLFIRFHLTGGKEWGGAMKSNENNTQALLIVPRVTSTVLTLHDLELSKAWLQEVCDVHLFRSQCLSPRVCLPETFDSIMMHRVRQRHHS